MTTITLHEGDNRDHLRRLIDDGIRFESCVCDPPYGLVSTLKRFGGEKAAAAQYGTDGAFSRSSAGFMGISWDGTGIERDPEFWRLIWDALIPGAYLVAFSSTRTYHRMACAIEDAGFVVHPMLGWVFGSGFPKAHNAAMAIDKELGVAGSRGGPKSPAHAGWIARGAMRGEDGNEGWQRPWEQDAEKVAVNASKYLPGSSEAEAWDGWAYGGQSLKPALEPIFVGQKPFSEKNGALNLLKHGVGAVNVDGCRVPSPGEVVTNHARGAESAVSKGIYGDSSAQITHQTAGQSLGRHPANLLHDGSGTVVAMFPNTSSGTGAVKRQSAAENDGNTGATYGAESRAAGTPMVCYGDAGSAARFFNCFPPEGDPIFYNPKASKADRAGSRHPTVKPITLMRWLCRLVTPPGGTVLDPFAGSGTTAEAARQEGFNCVLMEADVTYAADVRVRFDLACPPVHCCSEYEDILE